MKEDRPCKCGGVQYWYEKTKRWRCDDCHARGNGRMYILQQTKIHGIKWLNHRIRRMTLYLQMMKELREQTK